MHLRGQSYGTGGAVHICAAFGQMPLPAAKTLAPHPAGAPDFEYDPLKPKTNNNQK